MQLRQAEETWAFAVLRSDAEATTSSFGPLDTAAKDPEAGVVDVGAGVARPRASVGRGACGGGGGGGGSPSGY